MFDFDLDTVLEQPTRLRSEETEEKAPAFADDVLSGLEFEDEIPGAEDEQEEIPVTEKKAPYNAELAAEGLVSMLAGGNMLLTPLAKWKLKRKRDKKYGLNSLLVAFEKRLSGAEMTAQDNRNADLYQAYLSDKKEIEEKMPFSEAEIAQLKKLAVPACAATQINIGPWTALLTTYGMMQAERLYIILSA